MQQKNLTTLPRRITAFQIYFPINNETIFVFLGYSPTYQAEERVQDMLPAAYGGVIVHAHPPPPPYDKPERRTDIQTTNLLTRSKKWSIYPKFDKKWGIFQNFFGNSGNYVRQRSSLGKLLSLNFSF